MIRSSAAAVHRCERYRSESWWQWPAGSFPHTSDVHTLLWSSSSSSSSSPSSPSSSWSSWCLWIYSLPQWCPHTATLALGFIFALIIIISTNHQGDTKIELAPCSPLHWYHDHEGWWCLWRSYHHHQCENFPHPRTQDLTPFVTWIKILIWFYFFAHTKIVSSFTQSC